MKNILKSKLTKGILGGVLTVLFLSASMFSIYVYNPKFIPKVISSAVKSAGDKIVGKELAEKIDETRDENGATSIRTLFNLNKEENLEKHCEKKEEKGQVQEKCFKTYTNEEFGYSVDYPEDLAVQELSDNKRIVFSPTPLKEDTDQVAPIEVVVSNTNIDDEITQIKAETIRDYREETIKIGKIQAKKISGYMGLFFWGEASHTFVLYEYNGNIYEWSGYTEDNDIKNKFDSMISTIKIQ